MILKLEETMTKYITRQRKLLESFLKANQDKKLSAKDIFTSLQNENISQSSIYRNLSDMEREGKLRRFANESANEMLYQYLSADCHNHIHLACKICGSISHMSANNSVYIVEHVQSDENFYIDKGETTLYGICNKCKGSLNEK